MPTIKVSAGEIVDAVIGMLQPLVRPFSLPPHVEQIKGVEVLYNKDEPTKVMFHFVTHDLLETNVIIDLERVGSEGPSYLYKTVMELREQLAVAAKRRYQDNRLAINATPLPRLAPAAGAIRQALIH